MGIKLPKIRLPLILGGTRRLLRERGELRNMLIEITREQGGAWTKYENNSPLPAGLTAKERKSASNAIERISRITTVLKSGSYLHKPGKPKVYKSLKR